MMRETENQSTDRYIDELSDDELEQLNDYPDTPEAVEKLLTTAMVAINTVDFETPVDPETVTAFDADKIGTPNQNMVRRRARLYSPGNGKLTDISFGPADESHPQNYYYTISEPQALYDGVTGERRQPKADEASRSVTIEAATGSIVEAWGVQSVDDLHQWRATLEDSLPVSSGLFKTLREGTTTEIQEAYRLLNGKIGRDERAGKSYRTEPQIQAVTYAQLSDEEKAAQEAQEAVFDADMRYDTYRRRAAFGAAAVALALITTSQSAVARDVLRDVPGGSGVIAAADFFIDNNTDARELLLIQQRRAIDEMIRPLGNPSWEAKFGRLLDDKGNLPANWGDALPSAPPPQDDMHPYEYGAPTQQLTPEQAERLQQLDDQQQVDYRAVEGN